MDAYQYVDMFAAKGAEYLVVIVFLVSLVPFWRFLHGPAKQARRPAPETVVALASEWFQLPARAFYHLGHGWAEPVEKGVVRVGMDDFSQKLIGRCSRIKLPPIGSRLRQGSTAWELHSDGRSVAMLSPVNGEVVARNDEVTRDPGVVNRGPYGEGWLLEVKPDDMRADLANLLSGCLVARWMEETVDALRRRMAGNLGAVLQDGGLPATGFARNLRPGDWEKLAEELLSGYPPWPAAARAAGAPLGTAKGDELRSAESGDQQESVR